MMVQVEETTTMEQPAKPLEDHHGVCWFTYYKNNSMILYLFNSNQ